MELIHREMENNEIINNEALNELILKRTGFAGLDFGSMNELEGGERGV